MPDFAKKITKHCSEVLQAGETVRGAVFAQPPGAIGRSAALGVGGLVGGAVFDQVTERRGEEGSAGDQADLATTFPRGRNVVLAVTPQRLLAFGHGKMSGNPTQLLADYPLDQIRGITQEKRKVRSSLVILFSDGSIVDLDVVKTAKPERFVEAFCRVKG